MNETEQKGDNAPGKRMRKRKRSKGEEREKRGRGGARAACPLA